MCVVLLVCYCCWVYLVLMVMNVKRIGEESMLIVFVVNGKVKKGERG